MVNIAFLPSTSPDFPSVSYSYKKIERSVGELTCVVNFPEDITLDASPNEIPAYFKQVSRQSRSQKPQFHLAITSRYQKYSKDFLTEKANDFMEKFGYGKQPYITIFHNDTENSHLHIVSTKIDVETGKKLSTFYELFRALKIQIEWENETRKVSIADELDDLLTYNCVNRESLQLLLS